MEMRQFIFLNHLTLRGQTKTITIIIILNLHYSKSWSIVNLKQQQQMKEQPNHILPIFSQCPQYTYIHKYLINNNKL